MEGVKGRLGDAAVYLAGSYARGDWLRDSDLDLIVVSPRFRWLKLHERYALVRDLLPLDMSADLLLYTPEEFERARRKSAILQDMLEYAVPLTEPQA